jgi:hypothetical protein
MAASEVGMDDEQATSANLMVERVRVVIEDNALFIGYADDTRYWIPHEAIGALAWLISGVVLPILTNLVSDEIGRRRRDQFGDATNGHPELAERAIELYRREVIEIIAVSSAPTPNSAAIAAAETAAVTVLVARGWPADVAAADAAIIVGQVLEHLQA